MNYRRITGLALILLTAGSILWRLNVFRPDPPAGVAAAPNPLISATGLPPTLARTSAPLPNDPPKDAPPWQILSPRHGLFTQASLANPELRALAARLVTRRQARQKSDAWSRAQIRHWPTRGVDPAGGGYEFVGIQNGRYKVFITLNRNAGISIAADTVRQTPPFDVAGESLTIGIWDQGSVRATHQEFASNRVSVMDGASAYDHSSHVGGTLAARGVQSSAIGLAPAVKLHSYDWNSDFGEMIARAQADPAETNGIRISNHSYGAICGWYGNSWYGTWGTGYRESDYFGAYDEDAATLDSICHLAPYYLPFQAAGNDRDDTAPSRGAYFQYFYNGYWQYKTYDPATDPLADGVPNAGYDTIISVANAKNCVTIGSVSDAVLAGARSTNSVTTAAYSGWGPTDDGRIKPDLVANGESLYSSSAAGNASYTTMSGTSMATPSAAGAATLLLDWAHRLRPEWMPRGATLKALLIQTADDLGRKGPDYSFGWGLINTRAAALLLRLQTDLPDAPMIVESALSSTQTLHVYTFEGNPTAPIKATLCWTDPPGTPTNGLDLSDRRLVNDLDLKILRPDDSVALPWILDPAKPNVAATTGTNRLDNVEQVLIDPPASTGTYRIVVSTDQPLQGDVQSYSLILEGAALTPRIKHQPLLNTLDQNQPYSVSAEITPSYLLDPATAQLHWTPDETAGTWFTQALTNLGANRFQSAIPPQTCGVTVAYYLAAASSNGFIATDPPGAPTQVHRFVITAPVALTILGNPQPLGTVTPAYGVSEFASGLVAQASAEYYTPAVSGARYRCAGWRGTGSLPAEGATNLLSVTLREHSDLTWLWTPQFELAYHSNPRGLFQFSTWSDAGQTVVPQPAPPVIDSAGTRYAFAGWYRNDLRQPNAQAPAVNPLPPFPLERNSVLYARYLPENQDADGDGLPDWWELYFFGSLTPEPLIDSDGDGVDNLAEYRDRTDPQSDGSQPGPPLLQHEPLASPQNRPGPWVISATITDSYKVAQAKITWRKNDAEAWQESHLQALGVSNLFSISIGTTGTNGDRFEYSLSASDPAGQAAEIGPFHFEVAYPLASFTPTQQVDALAAYAEILSLPLTVSNGGLADLYWTASYETPPLSDCVENGPGRWTHSGAVDLWHISTNRAYSGTRAWYLGDSATWVYRDRVNASLISPALTLQDAAVFSFRHWIRTEPDSATHFWDGGVVELSTNDGVTYAAITPVGGYPFKITPNTASPFPANMPCYAGTGGWQSAQFDLADYVGQTVRLRFRFGSDAAVVDEGWYLDDIRLTLRTDSNTSWLACEPAAGTVIAESISNFEIRVISARLNPFDQREGAVLFACNDPITSNHVSRLNLKVRARPVLSDLDAAQSSTNGEGWIGFTQRLAAADGQPCDIRMEYSTDEGAHWAPATLSQPTALYGTPVISNDFPSGLAGVASAQDSVLLTNTVTAIWTTRDALPPLSQVTNARLRATAWNGFFASAAVTSRAFQVDNEPPDPANGVIDFNFSAFGNYVVGSSVTGQWSGFTDTGSGITNYYYALAPNGGTTNGIATHETSGVRADLPPGPHVWFVWARDAAGNIGEAVSNTVFVLDPASDSDGDGFSAGQEETAGTDARNGQSALQFDGRHPLPVSTNGFTLQWQSVSGRYYSIYYTNRLDHAADPWPPVLEFQNRPSTGGLMRWMDPTPNPGDSRYYRISVTAP